MRNYKHYKMRLRTVTPVFIGDGNKIGTKEYILDSDKHKIRIPSLNKMYDYLRSLKLDEAYETYMMRGGNRQRLETWLETQRLGLGSVSKFEAYTLDIDRVVNLRNKKNQLELNQIATFIKDPYGKPYVPGSSIKGMIRTALLAYEIMHNPNLRPALREMEEKNDRVKQVSEKPKRYYLKSEIENIETLVFHTLNNKEKKKADALNSNMKGLIVSDSRPLELSDLTLSQKVDEHRDGSQSPLPIHREALRPDVDIDFEISIDETVFPYSIADIFRALDEFHRVSTDYFLSKFEVFPEGEHLVYLGGGVGFVSKTIIYAAFGKQGRAVDMADNIFKSVLGRNYNKHKHFKDKKLGVSPHTCKSTYYEDYIDIMGLCELEMIKDKSL